jgi:hypothetical protein
MLDSTAEREAWERAIEVEVMKIVSANPNFRSYISEMAADVLDARVSKNYSFYNVNPDDLVTGRHLDGVLASASYAHERIGSLEAWRDTRWHVKAGRAIKRVWDDLFLPLIVASVVVFMLYCTFTVIIGWLS